MVSVQGWTYGVHVKGWTMVEVVDVVDVVVVVCCWKTNYFFSNGKVM